MIAQNWLTRSSLGWLLGAQFALISTHLGHLPVWVMAVWLIAAGWRVLVFQGRIGFPPRWTKLVLIVVALIGIRQSYGDWRGLEPMAALLITGFCFKLMEAATRRDAYVLLFLGYFVALTAFLFGQELLAVVHSLLALVLLLTAQVALHQADRNGFSWQAPRLAGTLLLQASPLMLLLFLVAPRLAPLWQVPMATDSARTGMSDEMAPGDIADLARSDALAFRARFVGGAPGSQSDSLLEPRSDSPPDPLMKSSELYWRGVVLDQFDGRAWRMGGAGGRSRIEDRRGSTQRLLPNGPGVSYEVYLEPTGERWLYALRRSVSDQRGIIETADYRLISLRPVTDKFKYRAHAWPDAPLDRELEPRKRRRLLALPAGFNPRTRQWASTLRAAHSDDAQLIASVLRHFRNKPYVYTLRPPQLGRHTVDDFLFTTRRGFCEHYASSFVFLLRAAGIPARVVAGYQGGEINPLTGMVVVRQYDAHAWAEAWLPGRGWVRFDPTAAVAPERVESGLEQAIGNEEFLADMPLSPARYRHIDWLNRARLRIDAVNYQWTRWVVNYDDETQRVALERVLGSITALRLLAFVAVTGGITLFAIALWLLYRHRPPGLVPEQRLYHRFCRAMARRGYPRPPGMAPGAYGRWLHHERPDWAFAADVSRCFEALQYRTLNGLQRRALLQQLRRQVRRAERSR